MTMTPSALLYHRHRFLRLEKELAAVLVCNPRNGEVARQRYWVRVRLCSLEAQLGGCQ